MKVDSWSDIIAFFLYVEDKTASYEFLFGKNLLLKNRPQSMENVLSSAVLTREKLRI